MVDYLRWLSGNNTWARACAGWDASQNMKVMRWGDNMRNVAVQMTEGVNAGRMNMLTAKK